MPDLFDCRAASRVGWAQAGRRAVRCRVPGAGLPDVVHIKQRTALRKAGRIARLFAGPARPLRKAGSQITLASERLRQRPYDSTRDKDLPTYWEPKVVFEPTGASSCNSTQVLTNALLPPVRQGAAANRGGHPERHQVRCIERPEHAMGAHSRERTRAPTERGRAGAPARGRSAETRRAARPEAARAEWPVGSGVAATPIRPRLPRGHAQRLQLSWRCSHEGVACLGSRRCQSI